MRRFLPAFLLVLAAFLPFAVGCDPKHDTADAGLVVAAIVDAGGGLPTTAPADTTTAAPPLATTTAVATGTVRAGDAGKPVVKDAGAADAKAPTAPGLPTFPIPNLPIDAGAFRFDAGGFKPPWMQ